MNIPQPTDLELLATICFFLAVLHTFVTKKFAEIGHRFPPGSILENLFHFLAEVEVVFGLWAFIFLGIMATLTSTDQAVSYLEGIHFTEAAFVFVIMAMASTKPVMEVAGFLLSLIARLAPPRTRSLAWYAICLTIGPILGSFITEPAAMTVTALLLMSTCFKSESSSKLRYSTLAVLFVNISIGGTLTHFAAPPVVMVAEKWGWNMAFMMSHFGWKSLIAVVINTALVTLLNFNELKKAPFSPKLRKESPWWIAVIHFLFLAAVVRYHASMAFFIPLFLLFIGWHDVTKEHQDALKLRESLLVGFFLGGLVTLGQLQSWWITPVIQSLSPGELFLGSTALTAITDNAALTYLGTLVPNLSDSAKYALVAGAVAGGGLTVIANAPNPIGLGLVKSSFGEGAVNPIKLLRYALVPTIIACGCLWLL
ncbi:MAG: putative Na+/H+ antiporter [Proteobacteria bacterium]|nr:putative Na+/H+ antiporter [Pseudomonadota bacterium]